MAKNKSPRRTYHQRWQKEKIIVPLQAANEVKSAFLDIDLVVEIKLPRGNCSRSDVQHIRDYVNLASALLEVGYGFDKEFFREMYAGDWARLQDALHSYYGRFLKTGSTTASGNELNALRNGIELAGAVINAALDSDPVRVYRTYIVIKKITDDVLLPRKVNMDVLTEQMRRKDL